MPADARGQARGAARPRDQAQPDLRQADAGVRARHHAVSEGRQLDAGAQARPVQEHSRPGRQPVQQQRRAAGEPDQVGHGRIGPGPELVQVTAGAEVRPFPAHLEPQLRVADRNSQRRGQCVPHPPVDRVTPLRPVQRHLEDAAGAAGSHPRPGRVARRGPPRRTGSPPAGELLAGLQSREGGRLSDQGSRHREPGRAPHQQRQRRPRDRRRGQGLLDQPGRSRGSARPAHERRWSLLILGQDHVRGPGCGGRVAARIGHARHHDRWQHGDVDAGHSPACVRVRHVHDDQRPAPACQELLARGRHRCQLSQAGGVQVQAHHDQHAPGGGGPHAPA